MVKQLRKSFQRRTDLFEFRVSEVSACCFGTMVKHRSVVGNKMEWERRKCAMCPSKKYPSNLTPVTYFHKNQAGPTNKDLYRYRWCLHLENTPLTWTLQIQTMTWETFRGKYSSDKYCLQKVRGVKGEES